MFTVIFFFSTPTPTEREKLFVFLATDFNIVRVSFIVSCLFNASRCLCVGVEIQSLRAEFQPRFPTNRVETFPLAVVRVISALGGQKTRTDCGPGGLESSRSAPQTASNQSSCCFSSQTCLYHCSHITFRKQQQSSVKCQERILQQVSVRPLLCPGIRSRGHLLPQVMTSVLK